MNVCGNSQLRSLSDHKINEWCILDALLVQVFPSPRAKVFISTSVCSSSGKDMFLSEPSPIIAFSCHWVSECFSWILFKFDLLNLLHFLPFAKQNWVEFWPRFQSCYSNLPKLIKTMDFFKLLSGFVKVVDEKKTKNTKGTKKTKPHNAVRPENSVRP